METRVIGWSRAEAFLPLGGGGRRDGVKEMRRQNEEAVGVPEEALPQEAII